MSRPPRPRPWKGAKSRHRRAKSQSKHLLAKSVHIQPVRKRRERGGRLYLALTHPISMALPACLSAVCTVSLLCGTNFVTSLLPRTARVLAKHLLVPRGCCSCGRVGVGRSLSPLTLPPSLLPSGVGGVALIFPLLALHRAPPPPPPTQPTLLMR